MKRLLFPFEFMLFIVLPLTVKVRVKRGNVIVKKGKFLSDFVGDCEVVFKRASISNAVFGYSKETKKCFFSSNIPKPTRQKLRNVFYANR